MVSRFKKMQRIAIFQYEWPILSYTINLATKLAESGYVVDYFTKDCSLNFADFNQLKDDKNVFMHVYAAKKKQKIGNIIISLIPFVDRTFNVISNNVLSESVDIIKNNAYTCFIGIEKKGMIWAGKVAEINHVPYLYYSLELYVEDMPFFQNDKTFVDLRKEEIKYHKLSRATIIQDEMRAEVLLKANEIKKMDLIYIPISILGGINEKRYHYFHEKYNIDRNKKVLLCLGQITKNRLSFELAEIAQSLGDEYVMVLHGPGERKEVDKLREKYSCEKLMISNTLVPHEMLKQLIASAHIGLVMFRNEYFNERLTAFSSEKIALYLQSGIPIVGFDIGNYRKLMNICHCGELIGNFDELPPVIDKIMSNYRYYSQKAFSAYNDHFNFEKHYHKLKTYLDHLN